MLTPEQAGTAAEVIMKATGLDGKERPKTVDTIRAAGLDPSVMEAVARRVISLAGPEQKALLVAEPALAVVLGISLAATYITHIQSGEKITDD